MRTGLALMGFGFVVARFGLFLRGIAAAGQVVAHQHSNGWSLWIGTALIGLGVAAAIRNDLARRLFAAGHESRASCVLVAILRHLFATSGQAQ